MTQPNVRITRLDNQLGVVPSTGQRPVGVLGVSNAGLFNVPAAFSRVSALIAAQGDGPAVEAAAHHIKVYGTPVVFVRTGQTIAGKYLDAVSAQNGVVSNFTDDNGGTSAITEGGGSLPLATALVKMIFDIGGTIGSTGIVFRIEIDGVPGGSIGLGTATDFDPVTGVTVEFGAGTISAGTIVSFNTTAPILASAGELVINFTGTSVPTINATPLPIDDFEIKIKFVTGGTIGVTGIQFQESYDDGRTFGPIRDLGTASNFTTAGAGQINLAAGTIVKDDNLAYPSVAPSPNSTELTAGFDALKEAGIDFEQIEVASPILDDATVQLCDTNTSGMSSVGKNRYWRGSTRLPVGGESEATYQASLASVFGSSSSTFGDLGAGACEFSSGVSGRFYRRPFMFAVSGREGSKQPEENVAFSGDPPLPVVIKDVLGNPKHHDETLNPGLDDLRMTVARTIGGGPQGVFINRARAFAPTGSDFDLSTFVRVMILALDATNLFFGRRLNLKVATDKQTGFIDELDALEIEGGATAALTAKGLNGNRAVAANFVLNRDDVVLSTKTLTGKVRVQPFAYAEFFEVEVGFNNPALPL